MLIRLYKKLLPFARPYTGKIVLASILNILSNLVGGINLFAILPIIGIVLGEDKLLPTVAASRSNTQQWLDKFKSLFIGATPEESLFRICAFILLTYLLKNI